MAIQNRANIRRLRRLPGACLVLELLVGVDGDLARVGLVLRRVELEVTRLRDDVDARLARVSFCFLLNATAKRVNLLGLQVDLLADEVRVPGRIRKVRLAHLNKRLDRLDELGAHANRRDLARNRVVLDRQRISVQQVVLVDAGLAVDDFVHEVDARRKHLIIHGLAVVVNDCGLFI